ncbi:hypothetical protein F511_13347 [Dorcoceras hygrometricum]|uniref:RING-type E3 ubiquitin transferase n=1 Tax=Dorcoceras hygrometricum TaxID=472368 RepID=A0A2Z7CD06_9LAMI|nr:hypothetical protein F511_13347 [Dorcoceras hygrometricum]
MARFSAFGAEDGHTDRRQHQALKRPRTSTSYSGETSAESRLHIRLRRPISNTVRLPSVEQSDEEEDEEEDEDEDEDEEDEEEEGGGGGGGGGELQAQPSRDTPAPVTVTLTDPDVLDCPICLEPLSPPVYQCKNGHISCELCCLKMKNKCGSCSSPIGYNRCRAIEKVIESVTIACKNTQHGCGETLSYSKKHDHEETCIYSPCDCPYYLCTHVSISSSLYTHFATVHAHACRKFSFNKEFSIKVEPSQQYIFLQEENDNVLFVLDHTNDYLGSLFNVVCVAPTSSKRSFSYEISARDGARSTVRVKTVAENMPKWVLQPREKKLFLFPKCFTDSIRLIMIELMIRNY